MGTQVSQPSDREKNIVENLMNLRVVFLRTNYGDYDFNYLDNLVFKETNDTNTFLNFRDAKEFTENINTDRRLIGKKICLVTPVEQGLEINDFIEKSEYIFHVIVYRFKDEDKDEKEKESTVEISKTKRVCNTFQEVERGIEECLCSFYTSSCFKDQDGQLNLFNFNDSDSKLKYALFSTILDLMTSGKLDKQQSKDNFIEKIKEKMNTPAIPQQHTQKLEQLINDTVENKLDNNDAIISWYTQEPLLYCMLNELMKNSDLEEFFSYRYIIFRLYEAIKDFPINNELEVKRKCLCSRGMIGEKELQYLITHMNDFYELRGFAPTTVSFDASNPAKYLKKVVSKDVARCLKNVLYVFEINTKQHLSFIKNDSGFKCLLNYNTFVKIKDISTPKNKGYDYVITCEIADSSIGMSEVTKSLIERNEELIELREKNHKHSNTYLFELLHVLRNDERVINLLDRTAENNKDESYYYFLGKVDQDKGQKETALDFYFKSKDILESEKGKDDQLLATIYHNIGRIYRSQGDLDKSMEFYFKSKEVIGTLGNDHNLLASTYNDIGEIYHYNSDFEKALEFYFKSQEIKLKHGINYLGTATTYNNIGLVYDSIGNYELSLEYYGKTKETLESLLEKDHPLLAISYNNIGRVFKNKRDYNSALEIFLKAKEIQELKLEKTDPLIAITYLNLAGTYKNKGELDNAISYYDSAYNIYETNFGEDDIRTLGTLIDLENCKSKKTSSEK